MAEPKSTTKAPDQDERARTLDDPPAAGAEGTTLSAVDCSPTVCEYGDKVGKWAGHDNYECPRCGRTTLEADEVKARNPRFGEKSKRSR